VYIQVTHIVLYYIIIFINIKVPHEMMCTGNGTTGNGIHSNMSRRKGSTTVVGRVAKVQVFVCFSLSPDDAFTRTKAMCHVHAHMCACVWPDARAFLYTSATPQTPSDLRLCDLHILLCTILFLVLRTLAVGTITIYYYNTTLL